MTRNWKTKCLLHTSIRTQLSTGFTVFQAARPIRQTIRHTNKQTHRQKKTEYWLNTTQNIQVLQVQLKSPAYDGSLFLLSFFYSMVKNIFISVTLRLANDNKYRITIQSATTKSNFYTTTFSPQFATLNTADNTCPSSMKYRSLFRYLDLKTDLQTSLIHSFDFKEDGWSIAMTCGSDHDPAYLTTPPRCHTVPLPI